MKRLDPGAFSGAGLGRDDQRLIWILLREHDSRIVLPVLEVEHDLPGVLEFPKLLQKNV